MIDPSGSFTYSKIVTVNLDGNKLAMKIFPNPSTDRIQIQISSIQGESIILQISDVDGKIVNQENITSAGTLLSKTINIAAFPKGEYFLSVKTNAGTQVQKFVKL